jgi:hypothetical protein
MCAHDDPALAIQQPKARRAGLSAARSRYGPLTPTLYHEPRPPSQGVPRRGRRPLNRLTDPGTNSTLRTVVSTRTQARRIRIATEWRYAVSTHLHYATAPLTAVRGAPVGPRPLDPLRPGPLQAGSFLPCRWTQSSPKSSILDSSNARYSIWLASDEVLQDPGSSSLYRAQHREARRGCSTNSSLSEFHFETPVPALIDGNLYVESRRDLISMRCALDTSSVPSFDFLPLNCGTPPSIPSHSSGSHRIPRS